MVDVKSGLKKLGAGIENLAEEAQRRAQVVSWKNQILNAMYDGTIKNLAKERGLRPQNVFGEPTIDDYRQAIITNVTLKELIAYCDRKGVPIRHVKEKIDIKETEKELGEKGIDEKVKSVADFILEFKPSLDYESELPYQAELMGWLKTKFPEAIIEKQRGSSRPDIVIGGIAIEVKGPTWDDALVTIADKCMRYSENFKQGIIIVLFNVHVNNYRYDEWLKSLKKKFPEAKVIKK